MKIGDRIVLSLSDTQTHRDGEVSMRGVILRGIFGFLIPFFGVFLFFSHAQADSPDSYLKGDAFTSGIASGHFNPKVKKQWSISYSNSFYAPVISGNTMIYSEFINTQVHIKAVNIYTRELSWKYVSAPNSSLCSPTLNGGYVFVCEGRIAILNISDGQLAGSIEKPRSDGSFVRITVTEDKVLGFTAPSHRLYAYQMSTWQPLWNRAEAATPSSAVITYKHRVYYNANPYAGITYAINLADGTSLWEVQHLGMVGNLVFSDITKMFYDPTRHWGMDAETGAKSGAYFNQGWPIFAGGNINAFSNDGNYILHILYTPRGITYDAPFAVNEYIRSNPLLVDGKIYFVTSKPRLVQFNTSGRLTGSFDLPGVTVFGGELTIDHGRLIIYNFGAKELEYFDADRILTKGSEAFTLRSPYTDYGQTFLGQLHAHYIPENPLSWEYYIKDKFSPSFTESKYMNEGYNFIALTEHNTVTPDPHVPGIMHIINSEEDTQPPGGNHLLAIGILNAIDETKSDQERVDSITTQNGIAVVAHPNERRYRMSWSRISALNGLNLFNIYSKGSDNTIVTIDCKLKNCSNSTDNWDSILSGRRSIFGTADDDYTPGNIGFDGGAVMVNAPTLSQEAIMENLKKGNFYAVQGSKAPRIKVTNSADTVSVLSGKPGKIKFIGRFGKLLKEFKDVSSASYQVTGSEQYLRVEVEADGKISWSQPIWVDKVVTGQTAFGRQHYENSDLTLETNTTEAVNIATSQNQNCPASGCITPVYSLGTTGDQLESPNLTFNYPDNLPGKLERYLSIFTRSTEGSWQKVASSIDTSLNTVSATLPHFSDYVLSPDLPATGTVAPVVDILSPTPDQELEASQTLNLQAQISNNQAVDSVFLYLDDQAIDYQNDLQSSYSYKLQLNNLPDGIHRIKLTVVDLFGNSTEKEVNFRVINSGYFLPRLSIESIDRSGNNLKVSGSITNLQNLKQIDVYADGYYLETVETDHPGLEYSLDLANLTNATHSLEFRLLATNGEVSLTSQQFKLGLSAVSAANIGAIVDPTTNQQTQIGVAKLIGVVTESNTNLTPNKGPFGRSSVASTTNAQSPESTRNNLEKYEGTGQVKGTKINRESVISVLVLAILICFLSVLAYRKRKKQTK